MMSPSFTFHSQLLTKLSIFCCKSMAFSPLSLLLITLLFHIAHARDSQHFNKIPSTTNINNNPSNDQLQQPPFLPEREHAYGHESGQLPPSTLNEAESKLEDEINEMTKFPGETVNSNRKSYGLYSHESGGQLPSSTLSEAESRQHLPRNRDPAVTELEDEGNEKTKFPGETINSNRNSYGLYSHESGQLPPPTLNEAESKLEDEINEITKFPGETINSNRKSYGLYSHESGQLPHSTLNEAESRQHLPGNRDPAVAELEDEINEKTKFPGEIINSNRNSYGLYGQESDRLPSSSSLNKAERRQHLPRNRDPAVTELEDEINEKTKFPGETIKTNNRNSNGEEDYYDSQPEEDSMYRRHPFTGSLNNQPQARRDTGFSDRETYLNNGGYANGVQRQGMSDTRFLEKGRYFYDVNAERYSSNHPYRRIRARRQNVNRNFHGNSGNAYQSIDDITMN